MKDINAKWHYPKMGEYPIKFGKYMQQNYPQIPCLVLYNGKYGVRFWNCTEECWDDEDCDDYFCDKEAVEKWLYIDSFQQEQVSVAEKFARIVRGNLIGIDKEVQHKFEQLYFEITGNKMYGGYND